MDKSVTNFNVRLRTIKLRELIVGIILSLILTAILMGIFPVIYDNDDLFFIVLLTCVLLFFAWALKGTTGLSNNFRIDVKTGNPARIINSHQQIDN